jgi:asparagine synthase (glutamine-hydrolysing)
LKENIILRLWLWSYSVLQKKGPHFIDGNEWDLGFAIYDVDKDEYFVARDHMGIIPLYIG